MLYYEYFIALGVDDTVITWIALPNLSNDS